MSKFLFLNTGNGNRKRKARFGVMSVEEAETADMYVCVPWEGPQDFPDNLRGVCVGCGVAVRYRPYAPKKPPKVCAACAPHWIAATRH